MEELNNNLEEVIEVEVIEPVEVLEIIESNEGIKPEVIVIGTAVIAGAIASVYGLKKLWDKRKAKKAAVITVTEVFTEPVEETTENTEGK